MTHKDTIYRWFYLLRLFTSRQGILVIGECGFNEIGGSLFVTGRNYASVFLDRSHDKFHVGHGKAKGDLFHI